MKYKYNCFECNGMQKDRECYEESDRICAYRKTADNDLIKYKTGKGGPVTLGGMLNEYIGKEQEEELLTQEEIDEFLNA